MALNTLSPVRNVRDKLGGVALLEAMCHWDGF